MKKPRTLKLLYVSVVILKTSVHHVVIRSRIFSRNSQSFSIKTGIFFHLFRSSIYQRQMTVNNDNFFLLSRLDQRSTWCLKTPAKPKFKTHDSIKTPGSIFPSVLKNIQQDNNVKRSLNQLIKEKLTKKPQKIQNCALLSMY